MTAVLSRRAIARELAPFAVAALLAYALVPLGTHVRWAEYAVASTLAFGVLAGTLATPWRRLPAGARLVLPVAFLLAAALLRDAGGGVNSGVSSLALLPLFWVALHESRRGLCVMVLGVGAFFVLPTLMVGGAAYPASGLRTGVLFMVVAGLVGATVQRLVSELHTAAREREALLARLGRLAMTDPLTGAANRRAWDRWLEDATDVRAPRPFAVGVLDLDHFKAYNDRYGHGAGDALLAAATTAWRAELRPGDELARIGGEEFAVLLPGADAAGAAATLRRLALVTPGGQSCSGGVAAWDGVELPDALMVRADGALYAAKRAGRDRVEQAAAPQPLPAMANSPATASA